jgi:hypothetical protein
MECFDRDRFEADPPLLPVGVDREEWPDDEEDDLGTVPPPDPAEGDEPGPVESPEGADPPAPPPAGRKDPAECGAADVPGRVEEELAGWPAG